MSIIRHCDLVAENIGRFVRESLDQIRVIAQLFISAVFIRWRYRIIVRQMYQLGVRSLPLVMFLSFFTGFISVLSLWVLTNGIARRYVGTAVFRVVLSEMGPAFTGLVLSSKLGAMIAAEIASLKVTQQLDALTCLNLNPLSYEINPRIIACLVMGPVLFIYSCVVAILGAQLLSTLVLGIPPFAFYNSMKLLFSIDLVAVGVFKATVFSLIIGVCSCYCGYTFNAAQGAIGVGEAIRNAVVSSSVLLLFANMVISGMLL